MCTFRRYEYFADAEIADVVRSEFLRTAAAYTVEATAYCFMPDHVHALVEGKTASADIRKCLSMFRQRTGRSQQRHGRQRLWQEGYVDRVLRREEATRDVLRYIVTNPIRAGLCADVRTYRWIGSSRYSIEELLSELTDG